MSAPSGDHETPTIPSNVGSLTGPLLLGELLNWLLLGALSLQVYIYSISFKHDKRGLKALVYFLFLLDILQTAFATHYAWYVLAGGWGNLLVLNTTPWTLAIIPPLSGLIALLVQGFFSWRIWKLAPQGQRLFFIPVLGFIGVTAVGACISAAWYAGMVSQSLHVAKAAVLDPEVTGWLAGSMTCDSIITMALVWLLSRRRNEGFSNVKNDVHRAIRLTVETGALTTIVTAIDLALYLTSSLTNWYLLLGMMIGKLYSNSLLASLNSRSSIFHIPTKSNLTFIPGVQTWDITIDDMPGNTSPTTGIQDLPKSDIELGSLEQDIHGQLDSKSLNLMPNSS